MEQLRIANPDSPRFVLMQHSLITTPLSTVVLLLLALPFSFPVGARRGSAVPGMLAVLTISGLYFAGTFLTSSMGTAGDFNPILLAWLPTVVFSALGMTLFLTMDQ